MRWWVEMEQGCSFQAWIPTWEQAEGVLRVRLNLACSQCIAFPVTSECLQSCSSHVHFQAGVLCDWKGRSKLDRRSGCEIPSRKEQRAGLQKVLVSGLCRQTRAGEFRSASEVRIDLRGLFWIRSYSGVMSHCPVLLGCLWAGRRAGNRAAFSAGGVQHSLSCVLEGGRELVGKENCYQLFWQKKQTAWEDLVFLLCDCCLAYCYLISKELPN